MTGKTLDLSAFYQYLDFFHCREIRDERIREAIDGELFGTCSAGMIRDQFLGKIDKGQALLGNEKTSELYP